MKIKKVVLTLISIAAFSASGFLFAAESELTAVNINTANAEQLAEGLSGVGAGRAAAIIEYRDQNGPFESADELTEVSGIGETILEANVSIIKI